MGVEWGFQDPGGPTVVPLEEGAVALVTGPPDWVRTPPELGGEARRVVAVRAGPCPHCRRPVTHYELAGADPAGPLAVAECLGGPPDCAGPRFYWYRRRPEAPAATEVPAAPGDEAATLWEYSAEPVARRRLRQPARAGLSPGLRLASLWLAFGETGRSPGPADLLEVEGLGLYLICHAGFRRLSPPERDAFAALAVAERRRHPWLREHDPL